MKALGVRQRLPLHAAKAHFTAAQPVSNVSGGSKTSPKTMHYNTLIRTDCIQASRDYLSSECVPLRSVFVCFKISYCTFLNMILYVSF